MQLIYNKGFLETPFNLHRLAFQLAEKQKLDQQKQTNNWM